jgi:hypothetical protein
LYYIRCSLRYGLRGKLPVATHFRLVHFLVGYWGLVLHPAFCLVLSCQVHYRLGYRLWYLAYQAPSAATSRPDRRTMVHPKHTLDGSISVRRQHSFSFVQYYQSSRNVCPGFLCWLSDCSHIPLFPIFRWAFFRHLTRLYIRYPPGLPDGSQFSFLFLDMYILLEWRLCIMENLWFGEGCRRLDGMD